MGVSRLMESALNYMLGKFDDLALKFSVKDPCYRKDKWIITLLLEIIVSLLIRLTMGQ